LQALPNPNQKEDKMSTEVKVYYVYNGDERKESSRYPDAQEKEYILKSDHDSKMKELEQEVICRKYDVTKDEFFKMVDARAKDAITTSQAQIAELKAENEALMLQSTTRMNRVLALESELKEARGVAEKIFLLSLSNFKDVYGYSAGVRKIAESYLLKYPSEG
jgi:hypothetical protein